MGDRQGSCWGMSEGGRQENGFCRGWCRVDDRTELQSLRFGLPSSPSLSTSMALLIVTSLTPHLPGLTQRPSHSSSTFRGSRPLSFDDQRVSWAQCLLKTSMSFRHTRCAQRPQGHMRSHTPSEPLIHPFTPILAVRRCHGLFRF